MSLLVWLKALLTGETAAATVAGRKTVTEDPVDVRASDAKALARFLDQDVRDVHLSGNSWRDARDLTVAFLRQTLANTSDCPDQWEGLGTYSRRNLSERARRLSREAHHAIEQRLTQLRAHKDRERAEEARAAAVQILARHESRVEKFLEIAYRKVAAPDDYGDENPQAFARELRRFLNKVAELEPRLQKEVRMLGRAEERVSGTRTPTCHALSGVLRDRFESYRRERVRTRARSDEAGFASLSGKDFELHLADMLRQCGATDVSGTASTGDQGGDLLFRWGTRRIVVQCKRYSGRVGNGAVQEVHAAKGFYGCDVALVVTNSQFTRAASHLAQELGVVLVDGENLPNLSKVLDGLGA